MFKSYLSARICSAVRCECLNVIGLRVVWYSGMVWYFEISVPSYKESFGVPEWLNEDFPLDLTTQNTAWSAVSLSLWDGLGFWQRSDAREQSLICSLTTKNTMWWSVVILLLCKCVMGWAFGRDLTPENKVWSVVWQQRIQHGGLQWFCCCVNVW